MLFQDLLNWVKVGLTYHWSPDTKRVIWTQVHTWRSPWTTEAEVGVTCLQAKGCQQPSVAGTEAWNRLPQRLQEEPPADTLILDFKPPELCENTFSYTR